MITVYVVLSTKREKETNRYTLVLPSNVLHWDIAFSCDKIAAVISPLQICTNGNTLQKEVIESKDNEKQLTDW